MILTTILLFIYFYFFTQVFKNSLNGDVYSILLYIIIFLPIYSNFQLTIYKFSENEILVNLIKFSKDFLFYSIFFITLFGSYISFLKKKWNLSILDKLMFFLMLLILLFLILPIGEADLISRILSFMIIKKDQN